ncbi:hypothetical protein K469DRAFT_657602 [Zopfia rhizophila CBS 207.26]|uniref:HIT-type domain-containing protein n=1 Tax=Zopfia rhizophila CBS 207.26 TaxID=1314779 RepID=A0A6A6EIZ4_9PEZI|nr:hypothetical protein K469DRAFT_657602 [Zopfia rhizophila CBS 207.26]
MATTLCGICNAEPKKYKCPTCSIPYCSLTCFKSHKPTHSRSTNLNPSIATLESPPTLSTPIEPPPNATNLPFVKAHKKLDFTSLPEDTRLQELLKTHPTLLPALQRIYAATLEPDPEDANEQKRSGFGHVRGGRGRRSHFSRGRGDRGRGRFGGERGRGNEDRGGKWTEKKGEADALKLLKGFRDGKLGSAEEVAVGEFVRLVGETFGEGGVRDEKIEVGEIAG